MKIDFSDKRIILQTVIIAAVVLLATSSAMSAYFLYKKANDNKKQAVSLEKPTGEETTNGINSLEPETQVPAEGTNQEEITIPEDQTTGEITVEWNEFPHEINRNTFFNYKFDSSTFSENEKSFLESVKYYKVGVIEKGPYLSDDLYIIKFSPQMPGGNIISQVIKDGEKIIFLENIVGGEQDGQFWGEYKKLFSINSKITISGLELPAKIKVPNSNYELVKLDEMPNSMLSDYDAPKKMFEYNGADSIYQDINNSGCFLVKAKDSSIQKYIYSWLADNDQQNMYANTPRNFNIIWADGKNNTDEFIVYKGGGCGGSDCYKYAGYASLKDLKKSGETNDGDIFYELANVNIKTGSDQENTVLQNIYDQHYSYIPEGEQKISFDDFLINHPVIYWQDPFGNFIEFRNAKYLPAAECGKPVIYLYPEKETDVSVSVNPTGGFKITEPAYDNGWKVKAKPDGEIYNYGDGKKYPYLFWEGYALNYQRPSEGFVVARAGVKEFLDNKLIQLGLIKKEADEFIEFWLPKMQEKPYYFITFMPQSEFENYAPLSVSPKPDTVIRIFMDYEGLDKYIRVPEQKIITPKREGFVVAEWGGAIHK